MRSRNCCSGGYEAAFLASVVDVDDGCLMSKKRSRGFFITFEGGEGAGKTSQITRLEKKLKQMGHDVLVTREPGGTPGAEAIRHVLLSGAAESFGPMMEALLFAAARSDHVELIIKPALEAGKVVISDRFIDSTRVYQGEGGKVDHDVLVRLEDVACGDVRPDLTVILDLPPEEGMKRANARRKGGAAADRFEKESISRQKRRRTAFRKIAKEEPDRCVLIDAKGSEAQVFSKVLDVVKKHLQLAV